jgi:hypothetical protein
MTTTLNASTAGAGGFIATSDNSGVLALQTAGTTAVTIDTSQNVGIGGALLAGTPGGAAGKVLALAATQFPQSIMTATSGTTGNKNVRFIYRDNALFQLQTLDDTYGSEVTAYEVQRSTTGITYQAWVTGTAGSAAERMRLDSTGNLQFNSGYGSVATAYGCRAWVNFNGTGTVAIRASGNVSSITDLATGTYTVNLTTAIVDANYAIQISSGFASGIREDVFGVLYNDAPYTPTTTAYTIKFYRADTNVAVDSNYSMTSIFR